jgi:hypothetical protein
MPVRRSFAGLVFAALALAACENLPYYDESLDFFSRSQYDPEVKAIEERTPPPQDSPVLSAPTDDAAMADPGGGGATQAGAGPDFGNDAAAMSPAASGEQPGEAATAWHAVTPATLPPRARITPPLGFARSKRVIYGNRGPFATGNGRTLR